MFFAAIDLGATYIKSCRIDVRTGAISHILRERFPAFDRAVEHKTVHFSEITKSVVRILEGQLAGVSKDCEGILVSNQMHGLVLLNGREVISPFYSWQDQRSTKFLTEIQERLKGFNFVQETGEYLRAGFPFVQLYALRAEGVRNGVICDLGNAVVQRLSGESRARLESTNAAATGAWNIQRGIWHKSLISELQLDNFGWPDVSTEDKPLGFWTYERCQIPVYASVGDQQMSLLGAGINQPGQVCFNIATGSQVSLLTREATPGDFQIRPYFDGHFLRTITHIPAGRALNRLVSLFIELNPAIDIEQAWDEIGSRIDVASLPRESLPIVNLAFFPSATGDRGSLGNLTEDNLDVTSLMSGALSALAQSHVKLLERLTSDQIQIQDYVGAGGILRKSRYLRNAFAQALNRELRLLASGEDALQGHAVRSRHLV